MTDDRALTLREVAALLQRPVEWMYRHRRELEQRHGFPPPIPGLGRRWSAAAVRAWRDRQALAAAAAGDETAQRERILAERAQRIAARHAGRPHAA